MPDLENTGVKYNIQFPDLSQFIGNVLPNDFSIIIGEKSYVCNRILADIASPLIASIHYSDPLSNCIKIPQYKGKGHFQKIIKFINGEPIKISTCEIGYLSYYADLLQIHELCEFINEQYSLSIQKNEVKIENVIKLLLKNASLGLNYDVEIDFLAKNIASITQEQLLMIPPSLLELIMNNDNLQIDSESWLLDNLINLSLSSPDYQSLFCSIQFNLLSSDDMEYFFSALSTNLDSNYALKSILLQFSLTDYHGKVEHSFIPNPEQPFDGIIKYLTNQCQGNICKKGIVRIKTSSKTGRFASFVVDSSSNGMWQSNDNPNSWLEIDFCNFRIVPTHYSLKSFAGRPYSHHLKSWVFEGSNDEINWIELDSQQNNNDLNGSNRQQLFECKDSSECRYFRIRATGKNHANSDYLIINSIELFGTLYEK